MSEKMNCCQFCDVAKIREFNNEEMYSLLGKVARRGCTSYLISAFRIDPFGDAVVKIDEVWFSARRMLRDDIRIDEKPAGVLLCCKKGCDK